MKAKIKSRWSELSNRPIWEENWQNKRISKQFNTLFKSELTITFINAMRFLLCFKHFKNKITQKWTKERNQSVDISGGCKYANNKQWDKNGQLFTDKIVVCDINAEKCVPVFGQLLLWDRIWIGIRVWIVLLIGLVELGLV